MLQLRSLPIWTLSTSLVANPTTLEKETGSLTQRRTVSSKHMHPCHECQPAMVGKQHPTKRSCRILPGIDLVASNRWIFRPRSREETYRKSLRQLPVLQRLQTI